ncbi:phosphoribosylaminoimidazole synthetase, partial [Enterococcus sp. 7D2_DIV0200]|uniref:phosphoribosylaminoimidazole synthetase n=2 Tax=Enterococcus TaxID=1350 RepID=UPI000A345883
MRVKCIAINGQGLNKFTLNNLGDTVKSEYPLKKDEVYTIYGQHIYKNVLSYLIIGTYENLPSWYPAELFEVVDQQVYLEWYYSYESNSVISALWGYK